MLPHLKEGPTTVRERRKAHLRSAVEHRHFSDPRPLPVPRRTTSPLSGPRTTTTPILRYSPPLSFSSVMGHPHLFAEIHQALVRGIR
jgi:hypothetical protein